MTPLTSTLLLALICLVGFALRIPHTLSRNSDADVAPWFVRSCTGKKPWYIIENSVTEGHFGAPQFTYWLISLFPRRWWKPVGHLLNLLYDLFTTLLIYAMALFLVKYGFVEVPQPYVFALWLAALYLTTPGLFGLVSRLKSFGARTFGSLVCLIYFLFFGAGWLSGNPAWYVGSLAAGAIVLFSSQFGLQNLIFCSIFLSLYYLSAVPLAVFLAAILFAFVVKPGHFRHFIWQKYSHYRWYFGEGGNRMPPTIRNRLEDYLALPRLLFGGKHNKHKAMELLTVKLTPFVAAWHIPSLLALIAVFCLAPDYWHTVRESPLLAYVLAMVGCGVFAFTLTSCRFLAFMGEAERYFEYTAPYILFLLLLWVMQNGRQDLAIALLVIQLLIWYGILKKISIDITFQELMTTPDWKGDPLIDFLNNSDRPLRILTIPVKSSWEIDFHIHNKNIFFYFGFHCHPKTGFDYMIEDFLWWSFPKTDFAMFQEKYGINAIIADHNAIEALKKSGHEYPLGQYPILAKGNRFTLYSLEIV